MKSHVRILAMLLAMVLLLSACGGDPGTSESGEPAPENSESGEVKDTLVIGNYAEPTVLDPCNQNMVPAGLVNVQIYDGLVRQDNETGEIVPSLAKSWEYVDDYHPFPPARRRLLPRRQQDDRRGRKVHL